MPFHFPNNSILLNLRNKWRMKYFIRYIIPKNLSNHLFIPAFVIQIHQTIYGKIVNEVSTWNITTDKLSIW